MRSRVWILVPLVGSFLVLAQSRALAGPLEGEPAMPGAEGTTLSITPGPVRTVYGRKIHLVALLKAGTDRVSKRNVTLHEGSDQSGWKQVRTATTDRRGRAYFRVKPKSNTRYLAVYRPAGVDSTHYAAAESDAVEVKVRPRFKVLLRPSGMVLPGRRVRLRGIVTPYVAGQRVKIQVFRGKRRMVRRILAVSRSGSRGHFIFSFKPGKRARYQVSASHQGSDLLVGGPTRKRRFAVAYPNLRPGNRGRYVRQLQRWLKSRGYATPVDGYYGAKTKWAVKAMRRVSRMGQSPVAGHLVWRRLAKGGGSFRPRYKTSGQYVEADLSRQILAIVENHRVVRIEPISSGSPATPTVLGTFNFYSKQFGYNAKMMLHSVYFIRGYAIHGYSSVPDYPASHGCLRIPISSARAVHDRIRLGSRIYVYH